MTRAGLVALLALVVTLPAAAQPRSAPGGVTISSRELRATPGHVLAATSPTRFDLVGFRWQGSGSVLFRARVTADRWSAWQAADDDNPSWVGPSAALQYRVRGTVRRLRAAFISSPVVHRSFRTLSIAGSPRIISRAQWGGDELLRRNHPRYASAVRLVIVHHTATPNNYSPDQAAAIVRGIDVFHVQTRGWDDIGYNFLIDRFGRIYEGRSGGITRNVIGAHALGFNTGSVGIALIGNFTSARPTTAAVQALERLIAWRLDLAHVDPASTLTFVSGGSERWRAGLKVKLRAVSGHRDTGSTTCPGNQLYSQLDRIALVAEQTGLPKLYAPLVRGKIGGPVVFTGRLSSAIPWTITVSGSAGRVAARFSGVGPAISWRWNSVGVAPGRYTWVMQAGSSVLRARGVVGGSALPPPATGILQGLTVLPSVLSPNGDGFADTATVSYRLLAGSTVTATIEDLTGATVATLFSGQKQSARAISFAFSPTLADGRYTLVLSAQADDGRLGSATAPFTIDRNLSAVTATPATLAPGAAVSAGFALAAGGQVTVTVLAPDNSIAATLFVGELAAGSYSYIWNALLADGSPAPAGHYQVQVTVVDALATVSQTAGFDVETAPP